MKKLKTYAPIIIPITRNLVFSDPFVISLIKNKYY